MGKNIFVADLKEGDRVDDLFLVKSAKIGETRAGKPYLVVTVMDKSGEISGPIWDNVEALQAVCIAGEVIRLSGVVQSYREKLAAEVRRRQEGRTGRGRSSVSFSPPRPEAWKRWRPSCTTSSGASATLI